MKVRIERFGLLGLAASCLTVWAGYCYFLASPTAS